MGRIIALALISGGIWWLWRRWQLKLNHQEPSDPTAQTQRETQRLTQCQRCDAMLPSTANERSEVAKSCEHGERCPLHTET